MAKPKNTKKRCFSLGYIAGHLSGIKEGLRLLDDGGSNRPADTKAWEEDRSWFSSVLQDALEEQIYRLKECEEQFVRRRPAER
jgi:hypothetical protein